MRQHLCVFFLFPLVLSAQLSMDDFLWSALETPIVQAYDNQNNYLESNPYQLSPIRAMEFRTESNQLDADRQDYALRLKAANPWEVKRNKQYFQTYQEVLGMDRQRKLKNILKSHYDAIIDWAYLYERKKLMEEERELTQTLVDILEAQRFSDYFDANDYTDLKIEQLEKVVALEELYFEEDALRGHIEALNPHAQNQTISWSFTQLISIAEIQVSIENQQDVSGSGEVAYRQKQVELALSEWALEKSNINVGFVQAQYQQYRIEQDRSPWSIGIGVNIPIFNPNKGNMTKRKLEMLEAEGNLLTAKNKQQQGLTLLKKKVKNLIQRYRNLQNQMDSLDVDVLATNLQEIEDSNPMTTVRLKSSLLKSRRITSLLKKEIYLAYIQYLGHIDVLQQQPFINYLRPGMD